MSTSAEEPERAPEHQNMPAGDALTSSGVTIECNQVNQSPPTELEVNEDPQKTIIWAETTYVGNYDAFDSG